MAYKVLWTWRGSTLHDEFTRAGKVLSREEISKLPVSASKGGFVRLETCLHFHSLPQTLAVDLGFTEASE